MRLTHLHIARSARLLLLGFLVSLIPATSHAGVFISVGFAPPPLLVYEQPPCPEPGLMWMPGYWAYGDDGYYWVPGAWVPAPYEGAYWTPGYWGWNANMYLWHPGYWGRHVGYYGGVNYGFGYMGVGFVGGMWRGHDFVYNTAVMRVDRVRIRNVYEDRRDVDRYTIRNDRHVAFSGGPGGIRHDPSREERAYMNERHMGLTPVQSQHMEMARQNRDAYYRVNHGRPNQIVSSRPLAPENRPMPGERNGNAQNRGGQNPNSNNGRDQRPNQGPPQQRQPFQTRPQEHQRPDFQNRPMEQQRPQNQQPQQRQPFQTRPTEHQRPDFQNRPMEQQRPQQERPQQERPQQERPQQQQRPQQERPPQQQPFQTRPTEQQRPQPQARPEPRPAPESRPAPRSEERQPRGNEGQGHGHGH